MNQYHTMRNINGIDYEVFDQGADQQRTALAEKQLKEHRSLSMREIEIRRAAWRDYYEKCRQSSAYRLFLDMKQAFREKNTAQIRELREKNKTILAGGRVPEPPFPDPDQVFYYMPRKKKEEMFDQKKRAKQSILKAEEEPVF